MKPAVSREIKQVAADAGATSWVLIRSKKHLIVDFHFPDQIVRQVVAATPSGARARKNEAAWLRRQVRS